MSMKSNSLDFRRSPPPPLSLLYKKQQQTNSNSDIDDGNNNINIKNPPLQKNKMFKNKESRRRITPPQTNDN